MALPKQVEKQLKEVEELEKEMQLPPENKETESDDTSAPPTDSEAQQAESIATEKPSSDTAEVADSSPNVSENWKEQYLTLQGKYNAEVPRLHQQNKELAAKLAELQAAIEAMNAPPKQEATPSRLITEKDEAEFGSDLIELVRRAQKEVIEEATRAVMAERDSLKKELADLKARLDSTSNAVTYTTFEQQLHRAIPDFEQVNTDPKWIAWLDSIDSFTGVPRRVYAEAQYARGNVAEIKRIVDLFKSEMGAMNAQTAQTQRKKELSLQVQPARSVTSSTPQTQQRKTYTEEEISRGFDRVRQLNIQGRSDEAATLEAELTAAYVEGRVIG